MNTGDNKMSKGLAIGLGTVVLAAGGITAGLLSGDVEIGASEGVILEAQYNIQEHQARSRAFRATNGKHIRVIGVEPEEAATVIDSELGRVVEVPTVPGDALCPVVFHANENVVDGLRWPVLQGVEWGMRPVQLPLSKLGKSYVWHAFVKGQDNCEAMAQHGSYLGSTMAELLALPPAFKRRCLVTDGTCDVEGQTVECTVPWGDPRAIADRPIRFPHGLAGRADINMVRTDSSGIPEDRIPEPDGGWGSEIPEPEPADGGTPDA
jgi:hypothetical protein